MAGLTQSYVHGASEQPLLGDTIGQFFDAACGKWAARPALVVRHQNVRWSYGRVAPGGRPARRRTADARPPARRPHRHLVAQQQRMGPHPVRHRQGRADPGQHQPGLSHRRARIRAQQSRLQGADHSPSVSRPATISACCASSRPELGRATPGKLNRRGCRRSARWSSSATAGMPARFAFPKSSSRGGEREAQRMPNWRRCCNSTTRSTSSSPRGPPAFPRARRCRTTISSTTAFSSARRCG